MSLIKCKECGKEISDKANKCPNCGCPVVAEHSQSTPTIFSINKILVDMDNLITEYPNRTSAIKRIRELTGADLKTATRAFNYFIKNQKNVSKQKKPDSILSIEKLFGWMKLDNSQDIKESYNINPVVRDTDERVNRQSELIDNTTCSIDAPIQNIGETEYPTEEAIQDEIVHGDTIHEETVQEEIINPVVITTNEQESRQSEFIDDTACSNNAPIQNILQTEYPAEETIQDEIVQENTNHEEVVHEDTYHEEVVREDTTDLVVFNTNEQESRQSEFFDDTACSNNAPIQNIVETDYPTEETIQDKNVQENTNHEGIVHDEIEQEEVMKEYTVQNESIQDESDEQTLSQRKIIIGVHIQFIDIAREIVNENCIKPIPLMREFHLSKEDLDKILRQIHDANIIGQYNQILITPQELEKFLDIYEPALFNCHHTIFDKEIFLCMGEIIFDKGVDDVYDSMSEDEVLDYLTIMEKLKIIAYNSKTNEYDIISSKEDFLKICECIPHSFSNEEYKIQDQDYQGKDFDNMSGLEFERYCGYILKKNSFSEIKITRASGDHGIDILAEKAGINYAFQCKCYSGNVGNEAVQQAHTGKSLHHMDVAVVITNQYFTQQAQEEAKQLGVKLWDRNKLIKLVNDAKAS